MHNSTRPLSSWLWPALAAVAVAWPVSSLAQASDIDPDALSLLRKSTVYLAATKQFSVVTATTIEVVIADGQKLQFDQRVAVTVQRPNKMRAERVGELIAETFYYDGTTLSPRSTACWMPRATSSTSLRLAPTSCTRTRTSG
jgi:hypothetical protein